MRARVESSATIRPFISAVAFLVKVTAWIVVKYLGSPLLSIRRRNSRVSACVFPDPAEAVYILRDMSLGGEALVFVWGTGRVELLVVSPSIVVVTAERIARSLVVAATVTVDVECAVDSLSH